MNLDVITDFLKSPFKPLAIYLFGSYASGNEKPESDVDLAILGDRSFDKKKLFDAALELGVKTNKDVHLVDFQTAPPLLKVEIISKGKILFCADGEKRLVYEMRALKEYEKLNEEREIIFKAKIKDFSWKLFSTK